jgi:hypothetical protein
MKTILTILTLSVLSVACLRAEDAPPIELKNKSSFAMDSSGRNPFWPIGWKPAVRPQTTSSEHSGPEIQPAAFVVSSITLDQGARFAIINGKAMQEGQVFGLQLGNQTYQLTVKAIEDGRVILLRRDEEIIVPLRRK